MKVAHISANDFAPMPSRDATAEIWRRMAEGVDAYHVLARARVPHASTSAEGNIRLHLLASWSRRQSEYLLTGWCHLPRLLKVKPDVIVAQCPVFGGLVGALASRLLGKPLVVEFHGEHLFARRGFDSVPWQAFRLLARVAIRRAKVLRVLSLGMKASLASTYGSAAAGKARVIPVRVDLGMFAPAKGEYSRSASLNVVCVGSLTPQKGQALLVRAMSSLPYLSVAILGEGPLRKELERLADELGVRERLDLPGRLPQPQIASRLRESDVYIHPSVTEATPRAVLEAMAVGLPVIATNVGYVSDLVVEGESGLLFSPGDLPGLLAAIVALGDDEALRRRMGSRGQAVVREHFDADAVFPAYRALLRDVAADALP